MHIIRKWFRQNERFFARFYLLAILCVAGLSIYGIVNPSNFVGRFIYANVMELQDWRETGWSERLELAEESIQQGETSQAVEMLQALIDDIRYGAGGARGSTRWKAEIKLGKLLSQLSRSEEAIEIFKKLLVDHSSIPTLHKEYARVLFAAGHQEEAMFHWQECLRLVPTDFEAVEEYTRYLNEANRQAEASEVVDRYWNAFKMANSELGSNSKLGLTLWNADQEVGIWELRPLVDQQGHTYMLPAAQVLNNVTDQPIDRISLKFFFGPIAHRFQLESIVLLGPKNNFTMVAPELARVTSFSDFKLSGLAPDQDFAQCFRVGESSKGRVGLDILLPNAISTDELDQIKVRMRVSKRAIPGYPAVTNINPETKTGPSARSGEN